MALQKSATQSRTYSGAVAALAVDGKRDNSSTLVARTKWSSQSWWEVDLEYSSNITSVSLYNHVKSPLTNFLVQLFDYKRWPVRNVTQIENRTANVNYDFDFPEGTVARYVRVQLMEEGELLLEEVEVYGTHLPGVVSFKYFLSTLISFFLYFVTFPFHYSFLLFNSYAVCEQASCQLVSVFICLPISQSA